MKKGKVEKFSPKSKEKISTPCHRSPLRLLQYLLSLSVVTNYAAVQSSGACRSCCEIPGFEVFFNVLDQKMEPQVSVKCLNQGINQNCSLLTKRSWAMPGVPIGYFIP